MANTQKQGRKPSKAKKPTPREVAPATDALKGVLLAFLHEHMEATGETNSAFARRAGCGTSTITDIVSGNRALTGVDVLVKVAAALGQTLGSVELASKQWARGERPAAECFGKESLEKVARLKAEFEAAELEAAELAAMAQA